MSYKTVPGTLPHRAVTWFKTQPPGHEVSTAELGEILECEHIGANLGWAVTQGIIHKEVRVVGSRRVAFWRLADDAAAEKALESRRQREAEQTAERRTALDITRVARAATIDTKPLADALAAPVKTESEVMETSTIAAETPNLTGAVRPAAAPFSAGLLASGGMIILKNGHSVTFTDDEVDLIVRVARVRVGYGA